MVQCLEDRSGDGCDRVDFKYEVYQHLFHTRSPRLKIITVIGEKRMGK